MKTLTIQITEGECKELVRILTKSLEDVRVEVHHTHTPKFRDEVLQEETLLKNLLAKFTAKTEPAGARR